MKMKKLSVVLLSALLLLSVFFASCNVASDFGKSRALCEDFLDGVIANDYEAAYSTVVGIERSEFDKIWKYIRDAVDDAQSYEINQSGWNTRMSDGVVTTSVTFKMTTDNGKTCYIAIVTVDNGDKIAGLHFVDSTEFIENTAYTKVVNAVLVMLSIALMGLNVWMLVDCIKRRIKLKALWIILIILGVGLSVGWGASTSLRLELGLLAYFSSIVANPATNTVTLKLILPVGSIVYFFIRKKLTLPDPLPETVPFDTHLETSASADTDSDDSNASDSTEKSDNENE